MVKAHKTALVHCVYELLGIGYDEREIAEICFFHSFESWKRTFLRCKFVSYVRTHYDLADGAIREKECPGLAMDYIDLIAGFIVFKFKRVRFKSLCEILGREWRKRFETGKDVT